MAASSKNVKSKTKITRKGQGTLAKLSRNKHVHTIAKLSVFGAAIGIVAGVGTLGYRAIAG